MAEAGLLDPSKPLPQANAQDFAAYRDFLDLDYGVSKQREGGITLSAASNGGEMDWIAGLLMVSTVDVLKFLNRIFRLGLPDNDPVASTLVTV